MKIPRISDAEWLVMKFAWKKESFTAHDAVSSLSESEGWSTSTVKTLLNRLHSKGALRFEKVGKAYVYTPAVNASRLRAAATASFLERVFDGLASPMIAHLANTRKLSAADLDELERILKEGRKRS